MTEIKIEKKRPVWPWLLLAVTIVGLIILYLLVRNDKEDTKAVIEESEGIETMTGADGALPEASLTAYFILIESDPDSMGLSHEFTNRALESLIQATRYTGETNDFDIRADLDSASRYADVITKHPLETSHADKIRKVANILTTALVSLQQARFPTLASEANDVKSAAANIDPDAMTLEQKAEVKTFFRESRDLLRAMNN